MTRVRTSLSKQTLLKSSYEVTHLRFPQHLFSSGVCIGLQIPQTHHSGLSLMGGSGSYSSPAPTRFFAKSKLSRPLDSRFIRSLSLIAGQQKPMNKKRIIIEGENSGASETQMCKQFTIAANKTEIVFSKIYHSAKLPDIFLCFLTFISSPDSLTACWCLSKALGGGGARVIFKTPMPL